MDEEKVFVDLMDGKYYIWQGLDNLEEGQIPADAYSLGNKAVAVQMATAMADKNSIEVMIKERAQ